MIRVCNDLERSHRHRSLQSLQIMGVDTGTKSAVCNDCNDCNDLFSRTRAITHDARVRAHHDARQHMRKGRYSRYVVTSSMFSRLEFDGFSVTTLLHRSLQGRYK